MPRNVRNFWIETRVRGSYYAKGDAPEYRDHDTGPIGKDGSFTTTIKVRAQGEVSDAYTLEGFANDDGTLDIVVFDCEGTRIHKTTVMRDAIKHRSLDG